MPPFRPARGPLPSSESGRDASRIGGRAAEHGLHGLGELVRRTREKVALLADQVDSGPAENVAHGPHVQVRPRRMPANAIEQADPESHLHVAADDGVIASLHATRLDPEGVELLQGRLDHEILAGVEGVHQGIGAKVAGLEMETPGQGVIRGRDQDDIELVAGLECEPGIVGVGEAMGGQAQVGPP